MPAAHSKASTLHLHVCIDIYIVFTYLCLYISWILPFLFSLHFCFLSLLPTRPAVLIAVKRWKGVWAISIAWKYYFYMYIPLFLNWFCAKTSGARQSLARSLCRQMKISPTLAIHSLAVKGLSYVQTNIIWFCRWSWYWTMWTPCPSAWSVLAVARNHNTEKCFTTNNYSSL